MADPLPTLVAPDAALPWAAAPRVPYWVTNVALVGLVAAAWPVSRLIDDSLDPYFLKLLLQIGIAVILAVSLNLINGITGQFSLGHAGFMGVGAYTCGVLIKHWVVVHTVGADPPAPPVYLFVFVTVLGGLVAAGAGLAVGVPTLRLRGDYLAIATLGFGEIFANVINQTERIGPLEVAGSMGLHKIPLVTNFFWVFAWCLVCVVAVWRLAHSAKGKAFYAVREDEVAAGAMGVDTTFHKVAAFTIGAFFAGVAGALTATLMQNLAPVSFNFVRSIEIVVMVVLGGSGSITGAILAAALLTYLPDGLRNLNDLLPERLQWVQLQNWRLVIYAACLILLMIVRPEGLLGSRELWWSRRRPPAPSTADPSAPRPADGDPAGQATPESRV